MKAIFAVSALAAAISAQAIAADTEATTTFTGAMDINFSYDLEKSFSTEELAEFPVGSEVPETAFDVDLKEDDFDWGLKMEVEVINGPFSGKIGIENDEGSTDVTLDDIVITDGNLKFGQVGNLMSTDKYIDDTVEMDDSDRVDDDGNVTLTSNLGDNIGFQYTVVEGAVVELGGLNDDALGGSIFLAAQYTGEAGALAYTVEGELQTSAYGMENDLDAPYFAGAGVTYTADIATVKAAVNTGGGTDGSTDTEFGVDVASTVAGATIGAGYYEPSTEGEDDEYFKAKVSYAVGAITPHASYKFTTAEDAGDELEAGVSWAQDNLSASTKVILKEFDAEEAADPLFETRASMTRDNGIVYYFEHDFQSDAKNVFTVGGEYNF